jgi:predicted phosphohydrolase
VFFANVRPCNLESALRTLNFMETNIQYASDIHLEFPQNRQFIKANPLQPIGDLLVLAGDIMPFAIMNQHGDFFSYLADHFEHTYWLPGNHEYYHFDIANKCGEIHEKIRSNITLVNNISVVHNDINMVFSTLWSKISAANQWEIERGLNDFHQIKHNNLKFTTEHYNDLHRDSVNFIKQSANHPKNIKSVVFSHHCPTFLNYPLKYKGDALNEAFATELYDFIELSNISYWCYGHHHCNIPDFLIGNTHLITNQLGYVQYRENKCFDTGRVISL